MCNFRAEEKEKKQSKNSCEREYIEKAKITYERRSSIALDGLRSDVDVDTRRRPKERRRKNFFCAINPFSRSHKNCCFRNEVEEEDEEKRSKQAQKNE